MILWLLLGMSVVMTLASVALTAANAEATTASKAAFRKYGVAGAPLGCVITVVALANACLWTWYAFDVNDWRFAAIFWLPMTSRWIVAATKKRTVVAHVR